jgi:ABC-2 type transport system ATP-binding protein
VKDVPIETLSKGFKRRVGIAQALIHNPKLLILDEPTDGLDPLQKFEVRKLITKLSKTKAIIISTHILDEVPEVCNKCLIINNGQKIFEGTPSQLKKKVGKTLDEKFRKLVD